MPVMDGLEFLRWLRQHSKYSDIAALMLTTQAGEQDKDRARDAGADEFMGKLDFDESRLVRSVERLLKRAGS
jgi:CheY-like chemotaxis protein